MSDCRDRQVCGGERPVAALASDSAAAGQRLPRPLLLRYAASCFAEGALRGIPHSLANPMLIIVLGANPGWVGLFSGARNLFDACLDPVIGHWSDQREGRLDRRRPLILAGGLAAAAAAAVLWLIPSSPTGTAALAWCGPVLLLLAAAGSLFQVPLFALGMELGPTPHERTRLMSYRFGAQRLALLATPWYLPLCLSSAFENALAGSRMLAWAVAALVVGSTLLLWIGVNERPAEPAARPRESLLAAFRSCSRIPGFWPVALLQAGMAMALGFTGAAGVVLSVYFVFPGDAARGTQLHALISTLGTLVGLTALPVVLAVSRRLGKVWTLRGGLGLAVAGSLLSWVTHRPENPWLQLVHPFTFGVGVTMAFVLLPSLLADVVAAEEARTGFRREALVPAMVGWIARLAGAAAAAIFGLGLSAVGFSATTANPQPSIALIWLRAGHSLIPAMVLSLAFLLAWRWSSSFPETPPGDSNTKRLEQVPSPGL